MRQLQVTTTRCRWCRGRSPVASGIGWSSSCRRRRPTTCSWPATTLCVLVVVVVVVVVVTQILLHHRKLYNPNHCHATHTATGVLGVRARSHVDAGAEPAATAAEIRRALPQRPRPLHGTHRRPWCVIRPVVFAMMMMMLVCIC